MDVTDLQSLGVSAVGIPTVMGLAALLWRGLIRNDQYHEKRNKEWETKNKEWEKERQEWEKERREHRDEMEKLYKRVFNLEGRLSQYEGRITAQDRIIEQLTDQLVERRGPQ